MPSWRAAVNVSGLLRVLVDRMVFCADARRRARLRLLSERLVGALGGGAALRLLADPALIPVCPHPQAAAWLFDLVRRRVAGDLTRAVRWNGQLRSWQETRQTTTAAAAAMAMAMAMTPPRFCFLGDRRLRRLVTRPLEKVAAEKRSQVLSESLDAHLAVLAIARFVLLRRRTLPPTTEPMGAAPRPFSRDAVCSSKTLASWRRACQRIVQTLLDHDLSLRGSSGGEAAAATAAAAASDAATMNLEVAVTITGAPGAAPTTEPIDVQGGLSVPVAPEPTPGKASFHFALLMEGAKRVLELVDEERETAPER